MSTLYKPEAEQLISDIHLHSVVGKMSVMSILHEGKSYVMLSEALSCLDGRRSPFINNVRGPYYFS